MPMKISDKDFFQRVDKGIHDGFLRSAMVSAQERLKNRKHDAEIEIGNWEEWRDLAEEIRKHTLENIDYYLEQLANNVVSEGGHVYFASTGEDANNYITNIVKEKQAKKIRSEEHTSELQSRENLVCRLLLEKK